MDIFTERKWQVHDSRKRHTLKYQRSIWYQDPSQILHDESPVALTLWINVAHVKNTRRQATDSTELSGKQEEKEHLFQCAIARKCIALTDYMNLWGRHEWRSDWYFFFDVKLMHDLNLYFRNNFTIKLYTLFCAH